MNILFLTITQLEDINAGGIYPDLLKFFMNKITIYMLFLREKENIILKQSFWKDKVKHLAVKIGNITKTKFIEKESQQ